MSDYLTKNYCVQFDDNPNNVHVFNRKASALKFVRELPKDGIDCITAWCDEYRGKHDEIGNVIWSRIPEGWQRAETF